MIFSLSFPALVRPFRCTRSPNGIAKVLLFFYSANFFRIFLKFFLSPLHITPPGTPEAGPGPSRHRSRTGSPNKKGPGRQASPDPKQTSNQSNYVMYYYIIPPAGAAGAGIGSGMSTIPHSVVRNIPATDAAFSRATRLTLVGSMTPASNILTNSPVRAL